jgi:hypothetical protein
VASELAPVAWMRLAFTCLGRGGGWGACLDRRGGGDSRGKTSRPMRYCVKCDEGWPRFMVTVTNQGLSLEANPQLFVEVFKLSF